MTQTAISSSSQIAADAGADIANAGGNAVDAAIAASLVQLVTEPGVVSFGASAVLTIWPAGEAPIMIDATAEMPGRNLPAERFGAGGIDVVLSYGGGGVPCTVGYGSVATPGALAGLALASQTYGKLPWRELVQPAIAHAKSGSPFPAACHQYVAAAYDGLFGWNPPALKPYQREDGSIKDVGETIFVEGLADSLATIAEEGADAFYKGDIARAIAADIQGGGGLLSLEDLAAYEARICPALEVELDDWHLATAALPSVGGATLAAMLHMMSGLEHESWTPHMAAFLIEVQTRVTGYRNRVLDHSDALDDDVKA